MTVGVTFSKIDRSKMMDKSDHDETDSHNSLKCNYWTWRYTKWPALAEICTLRVLPVFQLTGWAN